MSRLEDALSTTFKTKHTLFSIDIRSLKNNVTTIRDDEDKYIPPSASTSTNPQFLCDRCKDRSAEIFQVNGDYCLECWQELTYPMV